LVHGELFNRVPKEDLLKIDNFLLHVAKNEQEQKRKELIHQAIEAQKKRLEKLLFDEADAFPNQKISSVVRRTVGEKLPVFVSGEQGHNVAALLQALETRELGILRQGTSASNSPEYQETIQNNQELIEKIDPLFSYTKNHEAVAQSIKLLEEDLVRPVEERRIQDPGLFAAALARIVDQDPHQAPSPGGELFPGDTPFFSNNPVVEKAARLANAMAFTSSESVTDEVEEVALVALVKTHIEDHYKALGVTIPVEAQKTIDSFRASLSNAGEDVKIPGGQLKVSEAQRKILQGAFINLDANPEVLIELLGEDFVNSQIYKDMIEKTRQDFSSLHTAGVPVIEPNKPPVKDVSLLQSMFKTKADAETALGVTIAQDLWDLKISPDIATTQIRSFKALIKLDKNHPLFTENLSKYLSSLPGFKEGAPTNVNALVIFKFLELNAASLDPENQHSWYVYLNNPNNKELQGLLKKHGLNDLVKALPSGERKFSKIDKINAAITAANLAYLAVTHPDAAFMFALGLGGQIVVKKTFSFLASKLAAKLGVKVLTKAAMLVGFKLAIKAAITSAFSAIFPIPGVNVVVGWLASNLIVKKFEAIGKFLRSASFLILMLVIAPFLILGTFGIAVNPQDVARGLITKELGKRDSSSGGNAPGIGVDCSTNPTDPVCTICAGTNGQYDVKKCPWPVATGCVSQTDHAGHKTENGGSAIDIGRKRGAIPVNGQPIRATYPGTIIEARWNFADNTRSLSPDFGNMVRIRTSTNPPFIVIYAHLRQTNSVSVGQTVSPDTIIGYVDSTGYFGDGPHLHMEVHGVRIANVVPSITLGTCW
jgi:protein involved in temperature-dependent protein secretion